MPHTGVTAPRDREDQVHIGRVDLLAPRDTHGSAKATCALCLPERSGQPVTGISQHATETHSGSHDAIDLLNRDLGLCAIFLKRRKHTGFLNAREVACPAFRQQQPQAQQHRKPK